MVVLLTCLCVSGVLLDSRGNKESLQSFLRHMVSCGMVVLGIFCCFLFCGSVVLRFKCFYVKLLINAVIFY